MPGVLLVYATTHGHTAKVAARLAEVIRAERLDADVFEAADADAADPSRYEAVIAGGSVHAGHHQRELVNWVRLVATSSLACPRRSSRSR